MISTVDSIQAVHTSIQGRARFRYKPLRFNENLKHYLHTKLQYENEILSVSANTNTTSILIRYHPEISIETITNLLKKFVQSFFQNDSEIIQSVSNTVILENNTSTEYGLSSLAAQEHFQKYGPNILQEVSKRSSAKIFLSQFNNLPTALLSLSAGISFATGGFVASAVIIAVVLANTSIGYAMENSSERIISQLANIGPTETLVVRNGQTHKIHISKITIGDLIVLTPGNYVPADAQIVFAENLSIDESALTGESVFVLKKVDQLENQNLPLGDRINMVFRGTIVMSGQGLAIVCAIGEQTEIGKIQNLVATTQISETPMQKQMAKLSNQLVSVTGFVGVGLFGLGMMHGYGFLSMLNMAISLIVAAIPEGLPTVATTTLTQSTRKMRARSVVVRKLDAIETLGCIQVLCLDKTGTLTMNQMSATAVFAGQSYFIVEKNKLFKTHDETLPFDAQSQEEVFRLMQVAALCNEGSSPTEKAYLDMACGTCIDIDALRSQYPLLEIEHRATNKNYMITHHSCTGGRLFAIKGNPSEVLDLCDFYMINGERKRLTKAVKNKFLAANEMMGSDGLRVLGFAFSETNETTNVQFGHTFLGLSGLMDIPRPGVKEFIRTAHQSGIKTVMITGDQTTTAAAIARRLNLSNEEELKVFDSTHIDLLDENELAQVAKETHVFARVSPAHKLQIVQAIKRSGATVAMVGDGVNDAPALKAADVGIAMGKNGTEVAREVANVVLLDDKLDSLITAVTHGRATFDSIQKSSKYLLTTSLCELFLMSAAVGLGLGQPLNPQQLLWINLVIDIMPAIALAMDPPDENVLSRKPRHPDTEIIDKKEYSKITTKAGVMAGSAFAAYMYGAMRYGIGSQQGQTFAFMTIIVSQFMHALSSSSNKHIKSKSGKKQKNKYILPAVGIGIGMQTMAITVPGLKTILGVASFGIADLFVCFAASSINYGFDQSQKLFYKVKQNALLQGGHNNATVYC